MFSRQYKTLNTKDQFNRDYDNLKQYQLDAMHFLS